MEFINILPLLLNLKGLRVRLARKLLPHRVLLLPKEDRKVNLRFGVILHIREIVCRLTEPVRLLRRGPIMALPLFITTSSKTPTSPTEDSKFPFDSSVFFAPKSSGLTQIEKVRGVLLGKLYSALSPEK